MEFNVNLYKQKGNTCAIACLMMVLEYYKIIDKANWYDERRLFKIYSSKYLIGTPLSAIAYHLSKNGLDTTIYHFHKNLFNNDLQTIDDNTFKLALKEYQTFLDRAIATKAKVVNGVNINTKLIKDKILNGYLIILAGEINNIYHTVLLSGFIDDKFIVCDPLYKEKQLKTSEEIEEFMNTSIGKWFIAVRKD